MKKLLSIILSITVLFSSSFIYADNSEELSKLEYAKAMLAETIEINKILKLTGLTLEDLKTMPKKDKKFGEGLKQYLIEESKNGGSINWETIFDTSKTGEVSEESKNDADMWGYAWQMAQTNMKRDRFAKGLYQEAKYMYLSHYIDIMPRPQFKVDPSISNDGPFSAWITNSDRDAYDTYLNGVRIADEIMNASKTFVGYLNHYDSINSIPALMQLKGTRRILTNGANYLSFRNTEKGLAKYSKEYFDILAQEDNPVSFVNRMKATINLEDYDQIRKDTIEATFLTIVVASCGGGFSMIPLVSSVYSFYSYAIKDFYDKVWWTALIRYNNIRVSSRIMRYMEYYGM